MIGLLPLPALLWADSKYHNHDLFAYTGGKVRWAIRVVAGRRGRRSG